MNRRRLAGVVVLVATAVLPSVASAQTPGEPPGQAVVVLDGKGWGHGVGMAQDGALAMGTAGSSTEEILAAFYPGTSIGEAGGAVDVSIGARPAVEIGFPSGGEVGDSLSGQQSPGFPVTVQPGGSVSISSDGGPYLVVPLAGATSQPLPPPPPSSTVANAPTVPPTVAPAPELRSSRPLWAVPAGESTTEVGGVGRYRGVIRVEGGGGGGLQLVNRVDVEDYLRGMGEVRDPGWPASALRAQAIAARTYAVRAIRNGSTLCPDDRCQVYLGATAEYGAMNNAVSATAGQVLLYRGSLALAVYSASGGGISATAGEGFGDSSGEYPYLVSAPYPTLDPHPWTMQTPLADMAARFAYSGSPTGATVSRAGPSGRALEVTFEGTSGPLVVDAQRFSSVLQLRSTLFTLRVDTPPPPPAPPLPPDGTTQALGRQMQISSPAPLVISYAEPAAPGRRAWIIVASLLLAGTTIAVRRLRRREMPQT